MSFKIKQEITRFNSKKRRSNHDKIELIQILQDLERKEDLLRQNEKELLDKTNTIMVQEQTIASLKKNMEEKETDFINIQKRKDETISQLENSYYQFK